MPRTARPGVRLAERGRVRRVLRPAACACRDQITDPISPWSPRAAARPSQTWEPVAAGRRLGLRGSPSSPTAPLRRRHRLGLRPAPRGRRRHTHPRRRRPQPDHGLARRARSTTARATAEATTGPRSRGASRPPPWPRSSPTTVPRDWARALGRGAARCRRFHAGSLSVPRRARPALPGCVWAEDEASLLDATRPRTSRARGASSPSRRGEPLETVLGWVAFLGPSAVGRPRRLRARGAAPSCWPVRRSIPRAVRGRTARRRRDVLRRRRRVAACLGTCTPACRVRRDARRRIGAPGQRRDSQRLRAPADRPRDRGCSRGRAVAGRPRRRARSALVSAAVRTQQTWEAVTTTGGGPRGHP